MKNVLALSLVLLASTAMTMEQPAAAVAPAAKEAVAQNAAKAIEAVSNASKNVTSACNNACSDHGLWHSFEAMVKKGRSFVGAQWAVATTTATTLKSNGWNALNKNEKIGVAVAGTAIVATTAYLIYKLYNAVTKSDKNNKVCVNVRQIRC